MKRFFTILILSTLYVLLPGYGYGKSEISDQFYYITDDSNLLSSKKVIELFQQKKLSTDSGFLNLGFKNKTVWLVMKPSITKEGQLLTIQNAHLDNIDLYYYCNNTLISTKTSGDHTRFDQRDLENNFFNFFLPKGTNLLIVRISSEGPLFVPFTIAPSKQVFNLLQKYSVLHWSYFGFLFLILISIILINFWLKDRLYVYYALFLSTLALLTALDYGYLFQYFWPKKPEINNYNAFFYFSTIFTLVFTDKLFKTKVSFPKIHRIFKCCYLLFGIILLSNFFISYRASLQIFTYAILGFNLLSLIVSIFIYKKVRNSVTFFYFAGWLALIIGMIVYIIFLLTSHTFNFYLNNSTQIASAIHIIFLNLSILSNINILKKEKEKILLTNNDQLQKHIQTQNELIKEILEREKLLSMERNLSSSIIDTAEALIVIVDKDGKIVTFNKASEICSGYTFEELHGKIFWEYLIPKEEVENFKLDFEKIKQNQTSINVPHENNWLSKAGEKRWIVWDNRLLKNDSGEVNYIVGTGIDITEKKNLEKTAKKNELSFNSIVNTMKDPYYALDTKMVVTQFNDALKNTLFELFGIEVEKGKLILDGMFPTYDEYRRIYKENYQRVLQGESITFTICIQQRHLEHFMYPTLEENEVTGLFVLTKEITEKVKQEEDLRINEEKYRTLAETSPAALLVYDVNENKIIEANPKASLIFNINREELTKNTFFNFLPEFQENGERSIEIFKFQMDKALQGEQAIFEIDQLDRHGKIIPTEVYLNKFPSKNSTKLRATILDNTERKNYQNELKSYIQFQQELIHRIKEQEAGVSALINSSSDLIFSVDSNLYLTEFNDAFKNLVESSRNIKLTKGVSFLQYTFPELRESCSKSFKKSLQGESVNEIIECPKVSGDKCIMSVIYSPIFSADKKTIGVTVISRDITESKKAEEQLRLINKQVSEFKLKALRSAMNPHFLFNSLNSIQYFVAKNERKLALDYLSRFAVLIRKILDSSVNETVSLTTELEILKHYVSLEKLRFENKFDFEISVDPKIDEDQLFIPSLLIQPYVENAILHGLINKESVGFLQINISEKDKYLLVSVKDNGVGRKQASSARTPVKNKSYGMLLTQERLEMVNKTTDVSVNIIDLNDETGNSSGTRIDIFIKIK